MKKATVVLLVLIMAFAVALAAGCGSKVTVQTEEGKVTTTEKNGEVKVESEKGETTITKTEVTEADIGVPIYPNAQMEKDAAGSVSTKNEQGEATWSAAVMWTEDSVADVVAWYRDKLSGKPGFTDMSTTSGGEALGMMMFQAGDNTLKTVTIGKNTVDQPGTTSIAISSASGADVKLPQ